MTRPPKGPNETTLVVVIFVVVALIVGMILRVQTAFGHEGDDALATWYRSLKMYSGESCCSEHDCHPVDAKIEGDHWVAKIDDTWRPVPAAAILKRENMDGRAVVCIFRGELRCFVPPAAT